MHTHGHPQCKYTINKHIGILLQVVGKNGLEQWQLYAHLAEHCYRSYICVFTKVQSS